VGRLIFLVVIIHTMVFALVACGSATEQAREKTSASKISETVEDVSKLGTRRARRSSGSMTGDTSASSEVVAEGVAVFPDPLVEEMIRLKLDQPLGPILISDLKQLTALNLGLELYVADLSGLEHLVNITELDLTQNQVTDLSPIASLTKLTSLDLAQNDITDISPLTSLTNLTFLRIQDNLVTDISPLAGLTKLTELNLWTNEISDISPLAALTDLAKINLTKNKISDLSPLASLTNVTRLELITNEITDLSPLLQTGFAEGAEIRLWGEPLDAHSIDVVIPQLEAAGVKVQF
jgi:Leucine-rich repeat (LRR) protein